MIAADDDRELRAVLDQLGLADSIFMATGPRGRMANRDDLPRQRRAVFVVLHGRGWGVARIGRACGVPHSTVVCSLRVAGRRRRDQVAALKERVRVLEAECRLLARLAARTPQFDNPLVVWEAEKVRDRWLVQAGGSR